MDDFLEKLVLFRVNDKCWWKSGNFLGGNSVLFSSKNSFCEVRKNTPVGYAIRAKPPTPTLPPVQKMSAETWHFLCGWLVFCVNCALFASVFSKLSWSYMRFTGWKLKRCNTDFGLRDGMRSSISWLLNSLVPLLDRWLWWWQLTTMVCGI